MKLLPACLLIVGFLGDPVLTGRAETAVPESRTATLPVREVTIFKDGHAFVLRQGAMPTDAAGNVRLDDLPAPTLGTFWPFSDDKNATLASVVAGQRTVTTETTALSLRDLLRANVGADVHVTEQNGPAPYDATIVSIPEAAAIPASDSASVSTPVTPGLIVLRTAEGDRAVALDQIRDVTFKRPPKPARQGQEARSLMTLNLDWKGHAPTLTATVGMAYLQSGLRWLPSYKVTVDGAGQAQVQLEATLVNDLIDLQDVTANLVIGVPTFAAQDALDPISLQQTLAAVSSRLPSNSYFNGGFANNAYLSQAPGYAQAAPAAGSAENQAAPDAAQNEDLFVFTVRHVTLRKGQRLVLPIAHSSVKYADVYKLDLPYSPPPEVTLSLNAGQQTDLARQLALPRVMHVLRLCDTTSQPFTTAPALILRGGRVLAQGTMKYTNIGADADLEVTQALGLTARRKAQETRRTPNAETWNNSQVSRVDLSGTVALTNSTDRPAALEVTREVLGSVDTADHAGVVEKLNTLDDSEAPVGSFPSWWGWYSWPDWWGHFNGLGRITWKLSVPPRKAVTLAYAWHYFWR